MECDTPSNLQETLDASILDKYMHYQDIEHRIQKYNIQNLGPLNQICWLMRSIESNIKVGQFDSNPLLYALWFSCSHELPKESKKWTSIDFLLLLIYLPVLNCSDWETCKTIGRIRGWRDQTLKVWFHAYRGVSGHGKELEN